MSQALGALEAFLALSEAMACAAGEQEWEELVRLGEDRGALADSSPANLGTQLIPLEQTRGRMIIERCQQLDTQIRSLVDERQKALRILLREPTPVI